MPTIIDKPGFGERFGTSLGTGLGAGLQLLAQQKMNQLAQRQQQTKGAQLWQSLGLPQDIAESIAAQPESIQKSLLDRLEGAQFAGQQISPTPTLPEGAVAAEGLPPQVQQMQQPIQIGPTIAERRHRETLAQQRQIATEKANAPIIKDIREKSVPAREAVTQANNLIKLLESGKVITGIAGKILPNWLQTAEGQEFQSGINQLVLLKAQLGKGVPTRFRLLLEQAAKPDVWQRPKTIKKLLEKIRDNEEVEKTIAESEALENILAQEEQPRNLQSAINKETKKILQQRKPKTGSFTKETLPPAANYQEGQRAKNPDTGRYEFIIRNGQWEKI